MIKGDRGLIQVQRRADRCGGSHPLVHSLDGRSQHDVPPDRIPEQQNLPVPRYRGSGESGPQILRNPSVKNILAGVVGAA
jgi:hypothetical protein